MPARPKLSDKSGRHDAAYLRAKRENFAARAVYKLEEIDQKFRILRVGQRVLDLGCWPGSWMQYAATKVGPTGRVFGIDLRPVTIELPSHVEHSVVDVNAWSPELVDGPLDVVLSDMAPQTTGDRHSDQWKSEALAFRALELARQALRPGGHLVAKVFQGGQLPELLRQWRATFQESRAYHAQNSRASSTEQYLIGRGMRASARLTPEVVPPLGPPLGPSDEA